MAAAPSTNNDGTLDRRAFVAGLRRFATSAQVHACWESHGAPGAWAWDWTLLERPGAASTYQDTQHPYCRIRLTRTHPGVAPEGQQPPSKEQQEADAAEEGVQLEQQPDDACLLPSAHHLPRPSSDAASDVDWEFHIVYSGVFRVPGLWLAAIWPDGRPLTEAELARALPTPPDVAFAAADTDPQRRLGDGHASGSQQPARQVVERWTMLSQDEHPVLGRPFCCLHPCGTAARMRHLGGPPPEKEACDDGDDDDDDTMRGMAYLIKWFGLVAPVVGLRYPAAFVQRVLLGPGSAGAGHG